MALNSSLLQYIHHISHPALSQCPVNHIEWSPFSSDVFLSCSSDQIQLWKQDHFTPVFSFTSTQEVVKTIRWSPNWPTIFAAIIGRQLEIWDLDSNMWVRLTSVSGTWARNNPVSTKHEPLLLVWRQRLCIMLRLEWSWCPCCLPQGQTVSF